MNKSHKVTCESRCNVYGTKYKFGLTKILIDLQLHSQVNKTLMERANASRLAEECYFMNAGIKTQVFFGSKDIS